MPMLSADVINRNNPVTSYSSASSPLPLLPEPPVPPPEVLPPSDGVLGSVGVLSGWVGVPLAPVSVLSFSTRES